METSHSYALTDLMDSALQLAETAIDSTGSDEGWTPITIIGHVTDVDEQVWHPRISLMVDTFRKGLPTPSLSWWEPDAQATELKYRDATLDQVIAGLFKSRTAMIESLTRLSPSDWSATAIHDTFGEFTVALLPSKVLAHDREHFESLS